MSALQGASSHPICFNSRGHILMFLAMLLVSVVGERAQLSAAGAQMLPFIKYFEGILILYWSRQ